MLRETLRHYSQVYNKEYLCLLNKHRRARVIINNFKNNIMDKRVLSLSHEQIELIIEALEYKSNSSIEITKSTFFSYEQRKSILDSGLECLNLSSDIENGEFDV